MRRFEAHREDVVLELLEPGQRFLDLGCGEGNLLLSAFDKFDELYGLDVAAPRLARARQRATAIVRDKSVRFMEADLNQCLEFADDFFDTVVCISVLEHVLNPDQLVREIGRVLKPYGCAFVQVPNLGYLRCRWRLFWGKHPELQPHPSWRIGHLHYFTLESLSSLLVDHGMEIVGVAGSGKFPKLRAWFPALLSGDLIVMSTKISCGKVL